MHEYLRDTLVYRYRECKSCANRTEFSCIKCGFCWSCHWKMEQIEGIDLHNKPLPLVEAIRNYSQAVIEEKRQRKQLVQKVSPTITTVIDVYGEVAEPICDYLRCHHKLSVHGLGIGKCKCRHPQNITVGVS
jgi:hypothetical protein